MTEKISSNQISNDVLTDSDIVTTVSSTSTDDNIPSAKCLYDLVGNVETLIEAL